MHNLDRAGLTSVGVGWVTLDYLKFVWVNQRAVVCEIGSRDIRSGQGR